MSRTLRARTSTSQPHPPSLLSPTLPCARPLRSPPGTYLNSMGAASLGACQACPATFLCPFAGTAFPTTPCGVETYCPGGQVAAGLPCTPGSSCGSPGLAAPVPCAPGTFQDAPGQAACRACPASYHCLNATVVPLPCPAGYACPAATASYLAFPCPTGTYLGRGLASSLAACVACSPGRFCAGTGLSAPTGLCAAGWTCVLGAATATPSDGVTGAACPAGSWCGSGSSAPTPCPPGTFSGSTGNTAAGQCGACTAGWQCPTSGLTAPALPCPGGWCAGGAKRGDTTDLAHRPRLLYAGSAPRERSRRCCCAQLRRRVPRAPRPLRAAWQAPTRM